SNGVEWFGRWRERRSEDPPREVAPEDESPGGTPEEDLATLRELRLAPAPALRRCSGAAMPQVSWSSLTDGPPRAGPQAITKDDRCQSPRSGERASLAGPPRALRGPSAAPSAARPPPPPPRCSPSVRGAGGRAIRRSGLAPVPSEL